MDWTRICRSCMKNISPRDTKKSCEVKTVKMFCFCINTRISEEDKLPQQFCGKCVNKINLSYTFITDAQKTDLTLRNMLSRLETSVIVEPVHNRKELVCDDIKKLEYEADTENENLDKSECKQKSNEVDALDDYVCKTESIIECTDSIVDDKDINNSYDDNFDEEEETNSNFFFENETNKKVLLSTNTGNEVIDKREAKKRNVCVICLKKFASKLWFKKHMAKEHSKKKFNCKHCSQSFLLLSKLKSHLAIHTTSRDFACNVCGKRYKRRKQLTVHMNNHKEIKPFVCDLCSKSFKQKGVLMYHMTSHSSAKNFLCSHCGKGFHHKTSLNTHLRIHTGDKPFKCSLCPKAFNTGSSLRRHERLHSGECRYTCDTCARPFNCLASMNRHRLIHTGELPYKCPYCSRSFIDSWKRKVHIMRAHGVPFADIPCLNQRGEQQGRGRPPVYKPAADTQPSVSDRGDFN